MKKLILSAFTVALMLSGATAQKVKTVSGTPEAMKGQKDINVIFTYDNLKVGKMDETAYIEREIKEREDKEAGTGTLWSEAWKKDQQERYPLKFVELYNSVATAFDASIKQNAADSKYTIKVNTSFIEPGFNIGISRKPASINQEITFYETANPDVILHEFSVIGSPGSGAMGYDFDAGFRISESFAKSAKEYANFIYKKHLK